MIRALALLAAAATPALAAHDATLMAGKAWTKQSITLRADVACTPAEAYALWTTAEGVKRFFAPAARIEARPGGEYTILFSPAKDPEGLSHGTKGARVLRAVPGRELSFEWITFAGDALLGANAPPVAPRSMRDTSPLPTWVDIELEALPGGGTRVHFAHHGFGDGELWAQSHRWFTRAWGGVLKQLEAHCATPGRTA